MPSEFGIEDHDQSVERIDHPIEYNRDSVFALGCSCTWGVGVEREDTWARILQEKIGLPVYNLGVPGGGADSVFRQISRYLPIVQPRIVCIQTPSDFRREVLLEKSTMKILHHVSPFSVIGGWNAEERGLVDLLGEKELAMSKKKNYYAIIEMCRRYGAELRVMRSTNLAENPRHLEMTPAAADGLHPGISWHVAVADFFLNCPTEIDRIYEYVD